MITKEIFPKSMSHDILAALITNKFERLGERACSSKESFLFMLKSMYGDTFDMDSARIIYDTLYEKKFKKDCCDK